jgi:hypothetical protein
LEVDLRWQAAAGVDTGRVAFRPTALVGQHNRLRASVRPRRLFEDTRVVAKETGAMKGWARVLDSTPIFDAVATEDTVTQLRASIRKLLSALEGAGSPFAASVRAALVRDDDYATAGKPPCDWDDLDAPRVWGPSFTDDGSSLGDPGWELVRPERSPTCQASSPLHSLPRFSPLS